MLKRLAIVVGASVLVVACSQTDAGITTNVKTKLAADDTVKAYQIDVDTRNGVVTLSGAVETSAAKEQALRIAWEAMPERILRSFSLKAFAFWRESTKSTPLRMSLLSNGTAMADRIPCATMLSEAEKRESMIASAVSTACRV